MKKTRFKTGDELQFARTHPLYGAHAYLTAPCADMIRWWARFRTNDGVKLTLLLVDRGNGTLTLDGEHTLTATGKKTVVETHDMKCSECGVMFVYTPSLQPKGPCCPRCGYRPPDPTDQPR